MPAKMDTKMDIKVPDSGGFQWTPLERWFGEKPFGDNDLQRSLDLHGFPWIDAVERVMGIEPTYEVG